MSTPLQLVRDSDPPFIPVSASRPDGTNCHWSADQDGGPDGKYTFHSSLDLRSRLPGVGFELTQDQQGGAHPVALPAYTAHLIAFRLCNITDTEQTAGFLAKNSILSATLNAAAVQHVLVSLADLLEKNPEDRCAPIDAVMCRARAALPVQTLWPRRALAPTQPDPGVGSPSPSRRLERARSVYVRENPPK